MHGIFCYIHHAMQINQIHGSDGIWTYAVFGDYYLVDTVDLFLFEKKDILTLQGKGQRTTKPSDFRHASWIVLGSGV